MFSNQKVAVKSGASPSARPRARGVGIIRGVLLALLAWWLCDDLGLFWLLPALRGFDFDVLFAIVIGAWLAAKGRESILIGAAGGVVLFWFVVGFSPLAARMAKPLKTEVSASELARGADVVYVLASDMQPDDGFTQLSMSRFLTGLEIMQQKRAKTLVLAEIRPPAGSYGQATRRLCANLDIAVPIVRLPGIMKDTHDEAVAFASLAQSRGWKRAFVVTSPTHTRRASLVFQHAAREAGVVILPIASQEVEFDFEAPNTPGDRIRAFNKALHETIGYWIYKKRGWI